MVKNLPAMQETQVWSLGQEEPPTPTPEKEMAIHSSISCLGNPMDRGAWLATVHGIAESDRTEQLTPFRPSLLTASWWLVGEQWGLGTQPSKKVGSTVRKGEARIIGTTCFRDQRAETSDLGQSSLRGWENDQRCSFRTEQETETGQGPCKEGDPREDPRTD